MAKEEDEAKVTLTQPAMINKFYDDQQVLTLNQLGETPNIVESSDENTETDWEFVSASTAEKDVTMPILSEEQQTKRQSKTFTYSTSKSRCIHIFHYSSMRQLFITIQFCNDHNALSYIKLFPVAFRYLSCTKGFHVTATVETVVAVLIVKLN